MSLPESTISRIDPATQALWRAAETGNVDELVSVLPRVRDINARNEHGVTALMRAAQHGRMRVVRVLLDHGADANIIRNDKFTALALAAFFGHTEVVRALMEHGADSQASTRNATSPHMWATARTFKNVVEELKQPAPPAERPAQIEKVGPLVEQHAPATLKLVDPVARAVARAASGSTVVRTLKDPPEIWDLVHPAPKSFDARSAFVARLSSLRRGFAFRAAMVIVLASVCAVGVWVLRGVQARGERRIDRESNPAAVVSVPSAADLTPATPKDAVANVATPAAPVDSNATTPAPSTSVQAPASVDIPADKPFVAARRSARIRAHTSEQPPRIATNDVSQSTPAAPPAQVSPQPRSEQRTTTKNSTPLSPQLITPSKGENAKSKVIQWP